MQFAVAVIVSLWLAVYRCWAVMAVGCGLWGLVGLVRFGAVRFVWRLWLARLCGYTYSRYI